jgi:hypothetical protein
VLKAEGAKSLFVAVFLAPERSRAARALKRAVAAGVALCFGDEAHAALYGRVVYG